MASLEQKMAANMGGGAGLFAKATELKQRLLFVLGALIIYRVGTYIPLPAVNAEALNIGKEGGLIAMFNMFSGGALGRMTLFSLSVFPYITASIIMQLLSVVVPSVEALKKQGEVGRRIINQRTRYFTIVIASLQGLAFALLLERMPAVVAEPGVLFRLVIMATLVGGVMFLVWLGDQINTRGIGNGMSILIAAGIVAQLPGSMYQLFESGRSGALETSMVLVIFGAVVGMLGLIIFIERAFRKVLVQYPKRQVSSTRMTGGETSHMPLKLNMAGVIPAIFASALLGFPVTLAGFAGESDSAFLQWINLYLSHGKPLFIAVYAFLIVFFCFFYTSVTFSPAETAENLKKQGGFVPGIRPGEKTAEFFDYILTRLTVIGALYLTAICVVPEVFVGHYQIHMPITGTGLLIVVNVVLDTVQQIQTHLITHQYEALINKNNQRMARADNRAARRRRK